MFDDGRSRRVVFIAHCLLNQNAISDGTAVCPAVCREVVEFFMNRETGVVQMPCPELCCLGLDRGNAFGADSPVLVENTRIRESLKRRETNQALTELAGQVTGQILEYRRHGFEVVGVVGVNRSPSCGVDTTSAHNAEIEGMGLFIEKITRQLAEKGLSVPLAGIRAGSGNGEKLEQLLRSAEEISV